MKRSNDETEMVWIDAWNELYELTYRFMPYSVFLPDGTKTEFDELQHWLESSRAGRSLRLTGPIGVPASRAIRTSVWESRDPGTFAQMPREEKEEYAFLYDEFANNEVHRLDERNAWIELANFDGAAMLDHSDQMRLQGLITRARLRDERIDYNAQSFLKRAAEKSGLGPRDEPDPLVYDPNLCRRILPPQPAGSGGR